jgi:dipeptidyl-peptidase-4
MIKNSDGQVKEVILKKKNVLFLAVVLLLLTDFPGLFATSPSSAGAVSIEKMFDPALLSKLGTPEYTWLQNGKALLLDSRVEPGKRTFELLDPKNGKREPIGNPAEILTSLKKSLGPGAPGDLSWPDAIDTMGKRVLYLLAGDVFLVDLQSNEVKRLTQTPAAEDAVTFSPDGRWVGFIRGNDIYAIDIDRGIEKALTTGSSGTLLNGKLSWVYWEEIFDHTSVPYTWSPDSTAVAYLQSDDSPVSISTFVHFKPATQAVVQQRYPKAGQPNPNVRLGLVEIASAKTTWVNCGEYEYLARFNWLPDSKTIAVQTLNRLQSELKLFLADRETGAAKPILEEHQPAWININDTLYFLKNSSRFIWMSERDGYQHLYLYNLEGKLIRQLTRGEFMVLPTPGGLTSGNGGLVGVDEKRGIVYFTSNRKALKECHLYQVKLNGQGFRQISTAAGVHGVAFSPDMNFYLDTFSSAAQPGELSLYQAGGKPIKVVTPSAREALVPWELEPPEFSFFKARDGLELPVMMSKPQPYDAARSKAYPAIIYVYGGPGAQQVRDDWSSRRILWNNLLNREGAFVFVVEVRAGMAKSKALETSVYKEAYGMQNVKDILDAVAWIKQIPGIDPDRIGIWGGSGGGCTTLYVMTHSDAFKAGISLFPVTAWYYYDTIYTERYQGLPQENPEGYRDTSCVRSAANLKGQLLIVHGTYDDNVHPQNTYAFINQLIEHQIQFELMIYPWRKHGVNDYPGRIHMYHLMLDFWRRNLL